MGGKGKYPGLFMKIVDTLKHKSNNKNNYLNVSTLFTLRASRSALLQRIRSI